MSLLEAIAELHVIPYMDVLAWVVMAAFIAGVAADYRDNLLAARRLTAGAWWLFAVFWFVLIQHFAFVHRSVVQTVLILIAVPACLYVGWLVFAGRDSLLTLSRAVALMTVIYLPFETSELARGLLIEAVAFQTATVIDALSLADGMEYMQDPDEGSTLMNTFWFPETGRASRVVFECTGIGAMSIFGGLIAAVNAPLRRKAVGIALSISIIWVLNIGRNVFIALANGYQWFAYSWLEGPIMALFGLTDPARVSFFVADRVLAQLLAVVALAGLAWFIARWVPELLDIAEELLSIVGIDVELHHPSVDRTDTDPAD